MPPLNLYARVRFYVQFAHETAGAACTRSSLRPLLRVACALYLLGRMILQNSGAACREKAEFAIAERLAEGWIRFRVLAARCARSFASNLALPVRGRREDRVRAAPAVPCAMGGKKTHTSIQVQRKHSGLPCAMALRLMA